MTNYETSPKPRDRIIASISPDTASLLACIKLILCLTSPPSLYIKLGLLQILFSSTVVKKYIKFPPQIFFNNNKMVVLV